MNEYCPLEGMAPDRLYEGWLWEPNIPEECFGCIMRVTEDRKVTIAHDVINDDTGQHYPEEQDRYFVRGIAVADELGGRIAIEESGIDSSTGYDGPKEAETLFNFDCLQG